MAARGESGRQSVRRAAAQLEPSRHIMCVLVETGLPPERLELEVTETALIDHGAIASGCCARSRILGITVALDDFGTGYSSLNQLTMFPFDKIKIDKSFTKGMTNRTDCAAIVSAVLALAHSMGIETTAEGVETVDQLAFCAWPACPPFRDFSFRSRVPRRRTLTFDSALCRLKMRCRMPHEELPRKGSPHGLMQQRGSEVADRRARRRHRP